MIGRFQGLFALMNRSLRTEDRSMRAHVYRFAFVLLSYAMLVSTQAAAWMGAPGLAMFRYMCFLNFTCITVAGISFFATAITEEKEEMTLGLLKMAGVSPLSLLLGKSAPRLIAALVLLTAQLPFTMLAITLGGVSLHQVLAAYCCLFAYLVLVANVGLFASVVSLRSRTAGFITGLTLCFYFFGPQLYSVATIGFSGVGWQHELRWFGTYCGLVAIAIFTLGLITFFKNRTQGLALHRDRKHARAAPIRIWSDVLCCCFRCKFPEQQSMAIPDHLA